MNFKSFLLLSALGMLLLSCTGLKQIAATPLVFSLRDAQTGEVMEQVNLPPELAELALDAERQWMIYAGLAKPNDCILKGDFFLATSPASTKGCAFNMLFYTDGKVIDILAICAVDHNQQFAIVFWYGGGEDWEAIDAKQFNARLAAYMSRVSL